MCHAKLKAATRFCWTVAVWIFAAPAYAADGDPVAVRKWSGGMMSIETQWDLHVVIWPTSDPAIAKLLPRAADLALFAAEDARGTAGVIDADTVVVSDQVTMQNGVRHALARNPNESHATWTPLAREVQRNANEIHVHFVQLGDGSQPAALTPVLVEVDGVRLLFIPSRVFAVDAIARLDDALKSIGKVDFVYLDCEGDVPLPPPSLHEAWGRLHHRVGLFGKPESLVGITSMEHNTFAISKAVDDADTPPMTISLGETPWEMHAEWATLFDAMEKACSDSQAVFAKLSTDQMNFRPSNGTHTPRWNAEHMMGRQLLFFSQIYHEKSPVVPVRDLNPKQMPPDYIAAHDDWTGAEEAKQMQRVSAFTRRFAYLLEGLDLDQPAPGSRWTPRGLLNQMSRHYAEHTANTVKKFDLPEWPKR